MASAGGPWIGRTGLRLALAFALVAVVPLGTILAAAAVTISQDLHRLASQQQGEITHALALAAADSYARRGWTRASLNPVVDLVGRAGAAVEIRSRAGIVIRATPDYPAFPPGSVRREAVVAAGRTVGSVTVKFGDGGLDGAVSQFDVLRWRIRIAAAAIAVLLTVAVSLVVSRRITAPVDRLTRAARAMEAGDRSARAGTLRGVAEIRELAATFDQMADSLGEEARLRRNMVADIAHELRAPVTLLRAESEAMLDGVAQPSDETLRSIRDEALRLDQMVDDLQELSSAEAAALQLALSPNDLSAIAAEAADGLADAYGAAGVRLLRNLAVVRVRCDERRMREVAVNLLTNAVKFTPAGGSVTIETGPVRGRADLAFLRVTDTGVGIPASELPHVTERFFRGRGASGVDGSGIGLAIVDQLARGHGGRVDLVSEPGGGTSVTVTLPLADAGPGQGDGSRGGPAGA